MLKRKEKLLFLGFLLFLLSACGVNPGPNLPYKACLIQPKVTTKDEVLKLLGKPSEVVKSGKDTENWYYYHRVKDFWAKVPILDNYVGDNYIEVLKVIIKGNKVIDRIYYTKSF